MKCNCHFCVSHISHPNRHINWHPVTHHLLKPESLDPKDSVPIKDSVPMQSCSTCGHLQPQIQSSKCTERKCPTTTPEPHILGEFSMTCYNCHMYADS